jgi:hypothetical protein
MAVLAPSLVDLRAEIDARWPNRDRRTDGWYRPRGVGDPSDHWPDGRDVVHAIDIDKDGVIPMAIVDACRLHKGVCHYIIWNRTIWSSTYNMVPRAYTGKNPHTDHLHVSSHLTLQAEFYRGGWGIASSDDTGLRTAPSTVVEGFGVAWDSAPAFAAMTEHLGWLTSELYAGADALASLRT